MPSFDVGGKTQCDGDRRYDGDTEGRNTQSGTKQQQQNRDDQSDRTVKIADQHGGNLIDEDVAQNPSSDRREEAEDNNAEKIELCIQCQQCAGDAKGNQPDRIADNEEPLPFELFAVVEPKRKGDGDRTQDGDSGIVFVESKRCPSEDDIAYHTTPQGGLDTSKGKNIGLGRLREAVNKNADGVPFSFEMLPGLSARISVSHRVNGEDVYADVKSVSRL